MLAILVLLAGLLEAEPARDPQGDPLPVGAIARLGSARFLHGGSIYSLAFTPDGNTIVSVGSDGVVCLWNRADGRLVRRWTASKVGITWVVPSPDGTTLVTVDEEGVLIAWVTATGQPRFEAKCTDVVPAFSTDGKELAIPVKNKTIDIVDSATGKTRRTITSRHAVFGLALSNEGKLLATIDDNGKVRLFDAVTGKQQRTYDPKDDDVDSLAFSPDGKILAAASMNGPIYLWESDSEELLHRFDEEEDRVVGLRFEAQGKELVAVRVHGTVQRYDVVKGEVIETVGRKLGRNEGDLVLSPDRKWIVGLVGSRVSVYDLITSKEQELPGQQVEFTKVTWSPDGKTIGLLNRGGEMFLWRPKEAGQVRKLPLPEGPYFLAGFSSDGKYAASGNATDEPVRLWEVATGQAASTIRLKSDTEPLAFSPAGPLLAVGNETTFAVADIETGKIHWSRETVTKLATFTPDGRTLLVRIGSTLHRWEAATGRPRSSVELDLHEQQNSRDMAFSPDGKYLAVWRLGDHVQLLDTETGKQVRRFKFKTEGAVESVAFSPGGTLLVAGDETGTCVVWDVATGEERARLAAHGSAVHLAFSPEGKYLVTASADETALVWDLAALLARPTPENPRRPVADLWADLGSDDGLRAYAANRELTRRPAEALALIQAQVKPAVGVAPALIDRTIADLDSDNFDKREAAEKELARLDRLAEPALRKVLAGKPSIEVRRRVEALLGPIGVAPLDLEIVRALRAIEVLEALGSAEARAALETLSRGAPAARVSQDARAALERLQRRALLPR